MTSDIEPYSAPNSPPLYYRFVLQLAKPLYRLKVWQRSRHNASYHLEVNQRFGRDYPPRPDCTALIWCHAVSLGETNTVAPLLNELLAQGYGIWLTNTTQTGFNRADEIFQDAIGKGQLVHTFVPVDTPAIVAHFLDAARPDIAIFVETELWPVMLSVLKQRDIPAILVNARLSMKSYENYRRFASLSQNMMNNLSLVIAQNSDSAKRFRRLRLDTKKIRVAESLKWSVQSSSTAQSHNTAQSLNPIQATFDAEIKDNKLTDNTMADITKRRVWVAASTHEGEEAIAIEAHRQLITEPNLADTLLILVPRHPERFDSVAQLLNESNLSFARRSQGERVTAQTQVYLADTLGELMQWYAAADAALVGGSLVNIGGHNPIEAARLGVPIIMGPYTQTCQMLVDELIRADALVQLLLNISDDVTHTENRQDHSIGNHDSNKSSKDNDTFKLTQSLFRTLKSWLTTPILASKAGMRGQALVVKKQGAVLQQLEMIKPLLPPAVADVSSDYE